MSCKWGGARRRPQFRTTCWTAKLIDDALRLGQKRAVKNGVRAADLLHARRSLFLFQEARWSKYGWAVINSLPYFPPRAATADALLCQLFPAFRPRVCTWSERPTPQNKLLHAACCKHTLVTWNKSSERERLEFIRRFLIARTALCFQSVFFALR